MNRSFSEKSASPIWIELNLTYIFFLLQHQTLDLFTPVLLLRFPCYSICEIGFVRSLESGTLFIVYYNN